MKSIMEVQRELAEHHYTQFKKMMKSGAENSMYKILKALNIKGEIVWRDKE